MDKAFGSDRSSVLEYFKKSDKDVKSDVDLILASLEKLEHFPKIKDENAFRKRIEAFLVFNKFSIEKTKKKLDFCYHLRNIHPDMFDDWDPCSLQNETSFKYLRNPPLPKLTKDLNRITYVDFSDKLDGNFPIMPYVISYVMSLESRIPYDRNTGEIIIYNCSKVHLNIIKQITPTFIKKLLDVNLKGYSVRLAAVHFLFPPAAGMFILGILKTLMKPKLFERLHLHSDFESLYKFVPKECLPKNAGGDLPDIQIIADEWCEILRNNREYLIEQSKTRTDESKRLDKLNDDEYFGSMHGTFKKLDID